MKKTFFYTLMALTAVLLFTQSASAEARHHRHNSTQVRVNVGSGYAYREAYVVRRYAQPVYVQAPYYAAPVYVCPAPAYVEEVRVVPAYRPFSFGFSWNFFK